MKGGVACASIQPSFRTRGYTSRMTPSFSRDTSEEAGWLQVDLWRRMTPGQRAQSAASISLDVERLCLAGIRQRHPRATERECFLRLAIIKLGRDIALRVYPDAADLSGL